MSAEGGCFYFSPDMHDLTPPSTQSCVALNTLHPFMYIDVKFVHKKTQHLLPFLGGSGIFPPFFYHLIVIFKHFLFLKVTFSGFFRVGCIYLFYLIIFCKESAIITVGQ